MATMVLDLSDEMKSWVDARADQNGHGDPGDVVRDLISRELEREGKIANMQRLVDEGRASGISTRTAREIIAEARREAIAAGAKL